MYLGHIFVRECTLSSSLGQELKNRYGKSCLFFHGLQNSPYVEKHPKPTSYDARVLPTPTTWTQGLLIFVPGTYEKHKKTLL